MQEFSKEVQEKLGHYVYALFDDNGECFYIGKGQGDRVFNHQKEALKNSDSKKCQKIKEMRVKGLEPTLKIIKYKLREREAEAVEAALIDFIGLENLTNKLRGKGSENGISTAWELERKYLRKEFKENELDENEKKFMIIKITPEKFKERKQEIEQKYQGQELEEKALYETCRSAWKVSKEKAEKCKYVLCVYSGEWIVREVYEVIGEWKLDHRGRSGRYEFEGKVAPKAVREKFMGTKEVEGKLLGLKLPKHYRNGTQSPFLYSKALSCQIK